MEQLPATPVLRLTSPASCALHAADTANTADVWPQVAFLRVFAAPKERTSQHTAVHVDWLTPCYRLTPRVQQLSATAALLDLGTCTAAEAVNVVTSLLHRLEGLDLSVRVGVAPTATLAQLVVLMASSRQQIASVTLQQTPALLRRIPVAVLVHLLPSGLVLPETIARLQRYGLQTLGHVATLPERALVHQFGRAGVALAALAQGLDPHPFQPMPPPHRLRFSMRLPTATAPHRVLAALPTWSEQIAACLKNAQLAVRELCLVVGWDDASRVTVQTRLRQYIHDPRLLHGAIRALLVPLLLQHATSSQASDTINTIDTGALLDTVRLIARDLAPIVPQQGVFWQQRAQQQTALVLVADALAKRHGRALILCTHRIAADAIFPEERYQLHPVEPPAEVTPSVRRRLPVVRGPVSSSSMRSPIQTSVCAAGWQDVPHRLHWW